MIYVHESRRINISWFMFRRLILMMFFLLTKK
jgi:hypothetical protein